MGERRISFDDDLKGQIRLIDPALARTWLESNASASVNRALKEAKVDAYARSMAASNWLLNGESIKFSKDGRLLDGQHRLAACILADTPFKAFVFYGLDENTLLTIDTGSNRSNGDVLKITETCAVNHKNIAAALTYLYKHRVGNLYHHGISVSPQEVVELYKKNPGIADSFHAVAGVRHLLSTAIATFLHYAFSEIDDETADLFFEKLADGASLEAGNPILLLRNRLMRNRAEKTNLHRNEVMGLTIKAWSVWRTGGKLRNLRLRRKGNRAEDLPLIR